MFFIFGSAFLLCFNVIGYRKKARNVEEMSSFFSPANTWAMIHGAILFLKVSWENVPIMSNWEASILSLSCLISDTTLHSHNTERAIILRGKSICFTVMQLSLQSEGPKINFLTFPSRIQPVSIDNTQLYELIFFLCKRYFHMF